MIDSKWSDVISVFNDVANIGIGQYDVISPEAKLTLLDYSENATYLSEDEKTGEKYILRVSRPNYHTKQEIESEIEWLHSIHETPNGLQVAQPVAGKNGEYVQVLQLEGDDFEYYCTLFTYLVGNEPDESNEEKLIKQFESLGEITALLHQHTINFHEEFNQKNRLTWDYDTIIGDNPKWARWQTGKGMTEERLALYEEVSALIKKRLERFGKSKDRFGLIHSDLRLANLIVNEDDISVIDFDDCGFGWYLYDLGTSLSFIEHHDYVPDLIESWKKGYRKVKELTEEEENEIPTFVMMRRLQLISWVASRDNEYAEELGAQYTYDTDPLARDYLEKMRI